MPLDPSYPEESVGVYAHRLAGSGSVNQDGCFGKKWVERWGWPSSISIGTWIGYAWTGTGQQIARKGSNPEITVTADNRLRNLHLRLDGQTQGSCH